MQYRTLGRTGIKVSPYEPRPADGAGENDDPVPSGPDLR
jgi:hypothetical protein